MSRRSAERGASINLGYLRGIRALRLEYVGSMGLSVSRADARVPAPDRRSGMAKRKPEHTCELCPTLGDIVRALDPGKYRYGPECEVGLAFQAALELHKERAHKTEEGSGK
jgi:hypothetical protein